MRYHILPKEGEIMVSALKMCQQFKLPFVALLLGAAVFGQTITILPKAGPPTISTEVSGTGFSPNASIVIYFGTTVEALATANASGAFSNIAVPVPATAIPGKHVVTAALRSGGARAQTAFTVYTNWSEFGFSNNRAAFNPYENVLSPTNVSGLNGRVCVGSNDGNVYAFGLTKASAAELAGDDQ